MPLRQATMTIQFAGGISTDVDSKQVPQVKLLDLQNAVFTQGSTLVKRNGYRALGQQIEAGAGTYSGAVALGSRNDELLVFTSGGTYSYRPVADRMSLTGTPLSLTCRETAIARTGTEQSQSDAGTLNNVTVVAWVDSRGGIWWEVLEESTKRALRAPAQLAAAGAEPRVVPAGTNSIHIYYTDHSVSTIWIAVVNTFNPTANVTPTALTTDLATTAIGYDVCTTTLDVAIGGDTPPSPTAIVWATNAGTVRVGYVAPVGVLGSGATNLPPVITHAFAPGATSSMGITYSASFGVAFASSVPGTSTTNVAAYNFALTSALLNSTSIIFAATTLRTHTLAVVGTRLYVAIDDTAGAATERDARVRLCFFDSFVGPTVMGAPFPLRGASLVSRAFVDNSVPYVWVTHDVPFFSVFMLVRLTDGYVIARNMPTVAHGTQVQGSGTWTSTVSVDPTDARKWRVAMLYNEQLKALSGQFAETGIRWVSIDFDDENAWQNVQLGAGLYLGGACPQHYDGNRWAEAGFHYAPDGPITGTPAVGTGALTTGTYTYRVWYEETDATGEIHRGPVSVGTPVVLTAGQNQVTLVGPMYRLTGRTRVRVCIARSSVNASDEFFEVTSRNPTAGSPNGYILNDPTVDTWSFLDRMSDATLAGQNPMYTTGDILSNDPAPMAGGVLTVGKGRLFFTDPTDPTMVRYTQQLAEGYAAEFAEPLKQRLDPFGGDVTAIGIMDGAVYPFRETAVYVIGGPGPLPNPTVQSDVFTFTPGDVVTSDVGCTQPLSIVSTPVGIAFKSQKGIRLLQRDRKVISIGDDVSGFDSQNVVSATLLPKSMRIVFLSSDGTTLMFDYQRGQWSRFTNHAGLDSLIVGGVYYYLRLDGRVFVETPGFYRDDTSHIPMVLELAWLKMAGYLQGWQRVWYAQFLGEWRSAHTLRVRYRLNYELQWSAPFDLDVDTNRTATAYGDGFYGVGPYSSTGSSVYQRRIHIGKPCQAIQFQVQDVEQTDNYGASFELSELVLTGGLKGPLYKLEATRSS